MDGQQYDLTKTPKGDAERFARFDAAFELEYFTRSDDGTKDARLIQRSKGELVAAPKGRKATIRVDRGFVASFYQIKLALHIGRIPRPQADHKNRDWSDHRLDNLREATSQENGYNKRTPRKQNASLRKGVRKHKGGKDGKTTIAYGAQVNDADGYRSAYFPISKHGKPEARRLAEEAADANFRARDGEFHPHKRKSPERRP
jgi:hypothetical protein